ncbi:MAG: hypothetical protein DU429_02190 [Candidatus Tokpelaia sp.]|nr:MAG: hypothetical protein DU430_03910 [Candidatus Tokpelaia sp.]KAA6207307.1 MAG: hypothetical protein DU429_02190 [Candidatus Tokpelaia sp.]
MRRRLEKSRRKSLDNAFAACGGILAGCCECRRGCGRAAVKAGRAGGRKAQLLAILYDRSQQAENF